MVANKIAYRGQLKDPGRPLQISRLLGAYLGLCHATDTMTGSYGYAITKCYAHVVEPEHHTNSQEGNAASKAGAAAQPIWPNTHLLTAALLHMPLTESITGCRCYPRSTAPACALCSDRYIAVDKFTTLWRRHKGTPLALIRCRHWCCISIAVMDGQIEPGELAVLLFVHHNCCGMACMIGAGAGGYTPLGPHAKALCSTAEP
jgi:hypothetical protein